MSQGVSNDERRALEMLAEAGQSGCTEQLQVAQGFGLEMLAGLIRAEFASVTFEHTQPGGHGSVVARMWITEAGRDALAAED